MNKKNYHKYVFDEQNRIFIGKFDQMYKAKQNGKFALIKIFIPDDPIGYIKNGEKLVSEFNKHFNIVEHMEFISRKMIILFGQSKLIGEL